MDSYTSPSLSVYAKQWKAAVLSKPGDKASYNVDAVLMDLYMEYVSVH